MGGCFSLYAAYAKNLISCLKSSDIVVEKGLSEAEISSIESVFHFSFPPDLRLILQHGLPVSHGFPNWRLLLKQRSKLLLDLPILEVCKQVSENKLWFDGWGDRPIDNDQAVNFARLLMKKAPVLIPVFQSFYIPDRPQIAGNPIFYVHDGEIKLWSFNIVQFFQKVGFKRNELGVLTRPTLSKLLNGPACGATKGRSIEFWTKFVEKSGELHKASCGGNLGGFLDEMCWRLRIGGWKEEDVREMMMIGNSHEVGKQGKGKQFSNSFTMASNSSNSIIPVNSLSYSSNRCLKEVVINQDLELESFNEASPKVIRKEGDFNSWEFFTLPNISMRGSDIANKSLVQKQIVSIETSPTQIEGNVMEEGWRKLCDQGEITKQLSITNYYPPKLVDLKRMVKPYYGPKLVEGKRVIKTPLSVI